MKNFAYLTHIDDTVATLYLVALMAIQWGFNAELRVVYQRTSYLNWQGVCAPRSATSGSGTYPSAS